MDHSQPQYIVLTNDAKQDSVYHKHKIDTYLGGLVTSAEACACVVALVTEPIVGSLVHSVLASGAAVAPGPNPHVLILTAVSVVVITSTALHRFLDAARRVQACNSLCNACKRSALDEHTVFIALMSALIVLAFPLLRRFPAGWYLLFAALSTPLLAWANVYLSGDALSRVRQANQAGTCSHAIKSRRECPPTLSGTQRDEPLHRSPKLRRHFRSPLHADYLQQRHRRLTSKLHHLRKSTISTAYFSSRMDEAMHAIILAEEQNDTLVHQLIETQARNAAQHSARNAAESRIRQLEAHLDDRNWEIDQVRSTLTEHCTQHNAYREEADQRIRHLEQRGQILTADVEQQRQQIETDAESIEVLRQRLERSHLSRWLETLTFGLRIARRNEWIARLEREIVEGANTSADEPHGGDPSGADGSDLRALASYEEYGEGEEGSSGRRERQEQLPGHSASLEQLEGTDAGLHYEGSQRLNELDGEHESDVSFELLGGRSDEDLYF